MDYKYGYWEANGLKFKNKLQAMFHATETNTEVYYKYHNDVWANFDRTTLGKVSLDSLYKERAQQLRDTYDYLIIYYSGGSDSHNILRTFIDNDIKIDEICVKWPKPLIDGKLYNPDVTNTEATNYWSEWNYSVKPTLDWVARNKPEILITVKDFMEDSNKIKMESLFAYAAEMRSGSMNLNRLLTGVVSDNDLILGDKGINVGHVYGIDKPLLTYNEETKLLSMFFTDFAVSCVCPGQDPNSAECFYWTADMPQIPFEMAYAMGDYFIAFPQHKHFLFRGNGKHLVPAGDIADFQHKLARKMCYTNWDNRFQTEKARRNDKNDKYYFLFNDTEFETIKNDYLGGMKSFTEKLNSSFLTDPDDYYAGTRVMSTRSFPVRTL